MSNLPAIDREKVNDILESGRKVKSVFDIKENREKLEDPSIPNNTGIVFNGQLSEPEFKTFYNVYESGYSCFLTNTTVRYLQSVNTFKFRRFYHEVADAIINDKIIISRFREEELLEAIRYSHKPNTDYRLISNGNQSPYISVSNGNLMDYETELFSIKLNDKEVGSFKWIKHPQQEEKYVNFFDGYVDWNNIINKDTYSKEEIESVLDNKVDRDEIFDEDGNINETHIDYILNLEGTKFDQHIKNEDIHVSIEEKEDWDNKYVKPEHGIPKSDLDGECQTTLDESNKHMKNSIVHITANERREWNNAFKLPVDGINTDMLHQDIVEKLDSIFPKNDIINPETNQIYDSLIPIDAKNFVTTSSFNAHINNYNNHVTDDSIHVSGSDRVNWNNKYSKPQAGIPRSDLDSSIQNKLNNSIEWVDIVDPTTSKIYVNLLPASVAGGISEEHIKDKTIHVTQNDKDIWSRKYDGSSSSMLPQDPDNIGRRCIPNEHLSQSILDLIENSITKDELFDTNGKINSNKIDGLPNVSNMNNHISNSNIHVDNNEKNRIANAMLRNELLDNMGKIMTKYLPEASEVLSEW